MKIKQLILSVLLTLIMTGCVATQHPIKSQPFVSQSFPDMPDWVQFVRFSNSAENTSSSIENAVDTPRERVTLTPTSSPTTQPSKTIDALENDDLITTHSTASAPLTKNPHRILEQRKAERHYVYEGRGNKRESLNPEKKQRITFWQWLFGTKKPEPILIPKRIVLVKPTLDPELVDQPHSVLFKEAMPDQLEDGQIEILLQLSEQADTMAIYEVRGTFGFKGGRAERIALQRAEYIKDTLINAGVERGQIRIMPYDPSLPGLRGVVILRVGEERLASY